MYTTSHPITIDGISILLSKANLSICVLDSIHSFLLKDIDPASPFSLLIHQIFALHSIVPKQI